MTRHHGRPHITVLSKAACWALRNLKGRAVLFLSSYEMEDNALDTVRAHEWGGICIPSKEFHSININETFMKR